ncbi:transposase [Streptomyces sp. NPDC101152]|uniref:transposase n=1 Tax=Streptomyces sp. NPDC101152 TaxID=3366116 RepID=UPI00380164E1
MWFWLAACRASLRARALSRRRALLMHDVCTDLGAKLREFNGERDHVHLLVHYPPKGAIPDS